MPRNQMMTGVNETMETIELTETTSMAMTGSSTRRRMLGLLAGGALTSALAGMSLSQAEAKKKKGKKKKKGRKGKGTKAGSSPGSAPAPGTANPEKVKLPEPQFTFQPPTSNTSRPSGTPPIDSTAAADAGQVQAASTAYEVYDRRRETYVYIYDYPDSQAGDATIDDYGRQVGQWFYGQIWSGSTYWYGWYVHFTTSGANWNYGDIWLYSVDWIWQDYWIWDDYYGMWVWLYGEWISNG